MADTETNPENPSVTIEKLVYGGQGLARHDGRVVLVPFVLPGETAEVEIEADRRGVLEARLRNVTAPAAGRTDPPCSFFYRCGGCQYQHAEYTVQVEQKREIVREVLRRIGKIEAPAEIGAVTGEPWGYRNRTQFHIANGEIGFFGFGTHHLVPVDRCPISSPKLNESLAALREMLPDRRFPRFVKSIELFTNEQDVQLNITETGQPVSKRFFDWAAERIPGLAGAGIDYPVGGDSYRVRHRSFFQVNRFLIEPIVRKALEGAEGQTAADLYSGVGLFSLPLARDFAEVTAVESNGSAAADLQFNAERAGVKVDVRHEAVEEFVEMLERAPDFVLADPPRAGLGKAVVRQLIRLKPRQLTIVACDPATLARDLAPLTAAGYRIEDLTVVDLFPQTMHIETIAKLRA